MTSAVETDKLRTENQQLHRQLQELLLHARDNQQILQRHQAFDLRLISSYDFRELIETVSLAMPEAFSLQTVTLALVDDGDQIRDILEDLELDLDAFPNLIFLGSNDDTLSDTSQQAFPATTTLGTFNPAIHKKLFPTVNPTSIAIVPLKRQQQIIGYLGMGSEDPDRFGPHLATDFIERLASVAAICLENVINNERLKHLGLTDSLTGIHNRRYVDQRLSEEISRAQRERTPLSCLYIDIDYFKHVNDNFGHQSGDVVLRSISACIKKELRLTDALGRFGGEEFMVLLSNTSLTDAIMIGERIRISIAEQRVHLVKKKEVISVTTSIGVACLVPPEQHFPIEELTQQLITQADQALYQAKSSGRNSVVSFDQVIQPQQTLD